MGSEMCIRDSDEGCQHRQQKRVHLCCGHIYLLSGVRSTGGEGPEEKKEEEAKRRRRRRGGREGGVKEKEKGRGGGDLMSNNLLSFLSRKRVYIFNLKVPGPIF